MTSIDGGRRVYTGLGFLAILLWSATVALVRSLSERIGPFTAGALAYGAGGVLGCAWLAARGEFRAALGLPRGYLFGCGALFIAYITCLFVALGLSEGRQQAIEVGILNYLWPTLTLVFSVPILRVRARKRLLLPGLALGLAGAAIAPLRLDEWSAAALLAGLRTRIAPYLLAAAAAVLWALYSNVSRRTAADSRGGAVPLFVLATGVVLAVLRLAFPEQSEWSAAALAELAFVALLPTLLAYALWDFAVRRGDLPLLAAISYLTPILSTGIGAAYLRVAVGWNLWLACFLVVTGAALSAVSIRRR